MVDAGHGDGDAVCLDEDLAVGAGGVEVVQCRGAGPVGVDLNRAVSQPRHAELVGGDACGYGELWIDEEEDEVELARLIVPEALRGRGLGGLLTRLLTAEAATTGMATTMLRTTPDNTVAIACYLANGFTRLSPEEETEWNEGQRREWVWMRYGT